MKASEWREWLRQVQQSLGARLADTIGERPATNPYVRELVAKIIQLEAEIAGEVGS